MKVKFLRCKHCGNFTMVLHDSGIPMVCCGEQMQEVFANVEENVALEKHIPVVEVGMNLVKVMIGGVEHPMLEAHHIEWIYVLTSHGGKVKHLKVGEKPVAEFALLKDEKVLEVYEYCNLHGLWKTVL